MQFIFYVKKALENLGGKATLQQIYSTVWDLVPPNERRWKNKGSFQASVRACIENNSRDSLKFNGNDVFRHVSVGVWALRNPIEEHKPEFIRNLQSDDEIVVWIDSGWDEVLAIGRIYIYFRSMDQEDYPGIVYGELRTMEIQINQEAYTVCFTASDKLRWEIGYLKISNESLLKIVDLIK